MKVTTINSEVLFTNSDITEVSAEDLEFLKEKSINNERKRIRLCVHKDIDDKVHEMIIVHGKGAYVRPHKHLARSESLHVIEGEAYAIIFDDSGHISQVIHMGDKNSGSPFYYRISCAVYHSLVIVSDFFIFHEAVEGPFDKSKSAFAPFSPADGDKKNIEEFSKKLKRQLNSREG